MKKLKKVSINKLYRAGWIPNQHGAWAMIISPPIIGGILGGFTWKNILFIAFFIFGFFAFFSGNLWIKSRGKKRFIPPILTWSSVSLVLGLLIAFFCPITIFWIPIFIPLLGTAFYEILRHNERGVINNLSTMLAAALSGAVSYDLSTNVHSTFNWASYQQWWITITTINSNNSLVLNWTHIWVILFLLIGYFTGTAWYVKTLIRERGKPLWLIANQIHHVLFFCLSILAYQNQQIHICLLLVWVILLLRAVIVSNYSFYRYKHQQRSINPRLIGFSEIFAALLVFIASVIS